MHFHAVAEILLHARLFLFIVLKKITRLEYYLMASSLNKNDFATASPDQRQADIWKYMQRGLVYPSPHAIFATFWLKEGKINRPQLAEVMAKVRHYIHHTISLKSCHTTAIVGVSFSLWKAICADEGMSIPKGMALNFADDTNPDTSTVFARSAGSF
ncbi:MAG: hypothetical protein AAFO09_08495 [Pseudomonadota bacterium]